ncbi:hypothetical protein AB0M87_25845 [Streptomyces sp. NPDC051320]|uniref:hypothetical protein n=1 Tax=Streptomyces sp. NPDC051320 TaxID=3154644 RepID=UPI0034489DCE
MDRNPRSPGSQEHRNKPYTEKAMRQRGADRTELEHLLWDSLLHRELVQAASR